MARLARRPLALELPAVQPQPSVALRSLDPARQLLLTASAAQADLPAAGKLGGKDPYAVWQAPERWLLVAETTAGAERLGHFGTGALLSDLTDGLALFEIEGPQAGRTLQQAMTFDLAALSPGQAAVTLFAGLRATVYPWQRSDCWRLHVERASARFVWDWLATAAGAMDGTP
jgi:heterotetrameric sarcosine oxidase gamma subunit